MNFRIANKPPVIIRTNASALGCGVVDLTNEGPISERVD